MPIHQLPNWPEFHWNQNKVALLLAEVRHRQGRLLGRMEGLGFLLLGEATLQTLMLDAIASFPPQLINEEFHVWRLKHFEDDSVALMNVDCNGHG